MLFDATAHELNDEIRKRIDWHEDIKGTSARENPTHAVAADDELSRRMFP